MQKRGDVGTDTFFWISIAAITLLVVAGLIYIFRGGANEVISWIPI